jgi:hypothetical protein
MIEQRKHQRFDLRLPFEIVRGEARSKSVGETRNVSSSGVLFISNGPVAVGESIEYLITFPRVPGSKSEVRLRCAGKVLRNDPDESFAATLERYEFLRARA